MSKFVLLYEGGSMPQTPEDGEKVRDEWMAWFGNAGSAIVDPDLPPIGFPPTRCLSVESCNPSLQCKATATRQRGHGEIKALLDACSIPSAPVGVLERHKFSSVAQTRCGTGLYLSRPLA
jgi:hypothetical protein